MARSQYVYTVCYGGYIQPLATFTVKYESEDWALAYCDRIGCLMEMLVRYRYRNPEPGKLATPVPCPWESV